jgi:hypothetical protein
MFYNLSSKKLTFLFIMIILCQVIFPVHSFAELDSFSFSDPGDYVFDNTKIEFSSEQAQLKAVGTPDWYDSSWAYRKSVSIDNSANSSTLTDYQVKINVSYESAMQADFDDIRFTTSNGTTLIDYWLEAKEDSDEATFWVKIPNIPGSTISEIYMYYGNDSASTLSNGTDTFIVFDDFINSNSRQVPFGSDSGWLSGFDPVSRRFFFFSAVNDNLVSHNVTQWVNIDTGEVGYIYPPFSIANGGVVYHPTLQKFFIYGGSTNGFPARTNKIWSFDPATDTFTELNETLPAASILTFPVYDPTTDKVYLFGGRTSSTTRLNTIYVHNLNLSTPTVTNTGAVLPITMDGMMPTYSPVDNKIYLFGGAYYTGSAQASRVDILSYNPASPATNPIDTGVNLATAGDTFGTAYYDGNIYIFGGFNFTTSLYSNAIQKFNVVDQTISTLPQTLYKPDDDMSAFYDSVTNKIYLGPVLHSTGATNEDEHKAVVLEFDPVNETLAPEPTWGTTPTGWTSEGNDSKQIPRAIGGTYMVLSDQNTSTFVAAKKTFPTLSGVNMIEFKAAIPNAVNNNQIYVGPTAINALTNSVSVFRNLATTNWGLGTNTFNNNIIAAIPSTGFHILGIKIDVPNTKQYGLVNRANQTIAANYYNPGQLVQSVYTNTSTAGAGISWLYDWVIIRKSVVGVEPVATLGSQVSIYVNDNPVISPVDPISFTTLSGFSEVATKNDGEIKYQISNDGGSTWYWYDSGWVSTSAGYIESNTASIINAQIATFPVGSGSFLWRAYMHSNGTQLVKLDTIDLTYENTTTPTVTTQSVSNITATTATLNGTITATGGTDPTLRGFEYGLTNTYGQTISTVGSYSTGAYTASLTDLVCETQYSVRAFAENINGTGNGSEVTFTTDDCPGDIENPEITGITPNNNAQNITINTNLSITFNETIDRDVGNISIWKVIDDTLVEEINISSGLVTELNNIITINPSTNFDYSTSYYITIDDTAVRDTSGNYFLGITNKNIWNFTTMDEEEPEPTPTPGGIVSYARVCNDPKATNYTTGPGYGDMSVCTYSTQQTITPTPATPKTPSTFVFTRSLRFGMRGEDVRQLQIYLNTNGYTVSTTGPGSPGKETTYFGLATVRALIRFQEAHAQLILTPLGLTKGTGFFGAATMKVMK